MAKVLLGVTGSVAAIRAPDLYARLRQAGHEVKVVATQAALYFFDPSTLASENVIHPERNRNIVVLDEDEWPGRAAGQRYQRDDLVLHIELRRWADLFLLAPLDANTLAKLACGLADNCLTCVWRAWDTQRPVVLAPAMNTLMWEHPFTLRHLRQIAQDACPSMVPTGQNLEELIGWINTHCPRLRVTSPQRKRLACGDVGVGALAELSEVVVMINSLLDASAQ